jgi:hypothetical protein
MTLNLQSENINDLVAALSKAQGDIESAVYDKKNPHFKSSYASYDAIREVCRIPLAKNSLAITHLLDMYEGKRVLVTQLSHASGQWMRSFVVLPQERETPQAMGSAITYSKRYALSAFLAIGTDEDDDGEKAEEPYREILSEEEKKKIISCCEGDSALMDKIVKSYGKKQLRDIPSSEFEVIIQRITAYKKAQQEKNKEKLNENTGS